MAAKQPRLGLNHVTVVPTNFEPSATDLDADVEVEADDVEE